MQLTEIKGDLFKAPSHYFLTHCISLDLRMGAGISVEFQRRFKLRKKLMSLNIKEYPTCVLIGNVFNLITKKNYYHKPTYNTLEISMQHMKYLIIKENIKVLAMPKIGCGLDGLRWNAVKSIIEKTFFDLDIKIYVYYQ